MSRKKEKSQPFLYELFETNFPKDYMAKIDNDFLRDLSIRLERRLQTCLEQNTTKKKNTFPTTTKKK